MRRVLTKSIGRRFKVGSIHDLPFSTWKHIEGNAGMSMDKFSELVDDAASASVVIPPTGKTKHAGAPA